MSEFHFLLGPGHLSEKADKIAKRHGATLVNYTEPNGEKRHWFAGVNLGHPFDKQLSAAIRKDLEQLDDDELVGD